MLLLAYLPRKQQAMPETSVTANKITLKQAFWYWLKLGFISFGGPAGQIAIMHQDLVEKQRWISEQRFLHALNYCMMLPGPEAQQLATYIGWLMHKTWGGIIAGSLFVLPSLIILIFLSWLYMAFGHLTLVSGLLYGVKPAVTAIVLFAACRIGLRVLKNQWLWGIAISAFLALFALDAPFPLVIFSAAVAGALGGKLAPENFMPAAQNQSETENSEIPGQPLQERFTWRGLLKILGIGLLLWLSAMAVLYAMFGWHSPLTQMAWFFTKAAWLTFGGAYAVLPYVYQGTVEHYHWLNAGQMIDGLALGETTPGPLVMVVSFVAFVAGWGQALFGETHKFLAGATAALVVTYFTFLPSFILIFAGAPLVESTRGNIKFTAPLTGITAAVTGVIANLAAFFAGHVFWPSGFTGAADYRALLIAVLAFLALSRFKTGVIPVITGSALAGLIVSFAST